MHSVGTLSSITVAALCGAALMTLACEIERQSARSVLSAVLAQPQSVQEACVPPADDQGRHRLYAKAFGDARKRTVAMDIEVDDVVRRFSLAGIRIAFERGRLHRLRRLPTLDSSLRARLRARVCVGAHATAQIK